ncbi:hypothetical protein SAMN05216226_10186 [Halovenus aranensis]|jgi:hypothetical protein|uniref:Uncharacterized protein n=1 Tax=Halovenus aranensis TaxID=890420 RepID=A0A1G8RS09_9EURY|nr:hypothetical protein [Halovenus aranensis]SDJ19746.1 hypothetical protein SAMN05216226_10186 [Halovenus aranensis]
MSDSTIAAFLKEHPRMLGVLFTLSVLMTQVGSVAANSNAITGP